MVSCPVLLVLLSVLTCVISLAPTYSLDYITASKTPWYNFKPRPASSEGGDYKLNCTLNGCNGISYRTLATRYFKGMFRTQRQIRIVEKRWKIQHRINYKTKLQNQTWFGTDYDICCPTRRSHRKDSHRVNIFGVPKAICHMWWLKTPRYQWIPHAECTNLGSCSGQCRIEKVTVSLLVVRTGVPALPGWLIPCEYDFFEVPGYCSCKSTKISRPRNSNSWRSA